MNATKRRLVYSTAGFGIILSFFLSGCSTIDSVVGKELRAENEEVYITQGMDVEDLIAGIGEPVEILPTDPVREGFEVWVYSKVYKNVEPKVTGTKETPHFDPITGIETPIIDPIYSLETTVSKKTTRFLVAEGKVLSWKVEQENSRGYD